MFSIVPPDIHHTNPCFDFANGSITVIFEDNEIAFQTSVGQAVLT